MDKTAKTELHRLFLLEDLPEPLARSSSHIQVFDNYIENTRIRLRSLRDPQTKKWTRILQQRFAANENDLAATKLAELYLNDAEYAVFERFGGREIRKNRYFHEFDRTLFAFDVYLGELWGLNTARADFESVDAMRSFEPPPFAIFEVTSDPFFFGENLVGKKFADVQSEVAKIGAAVPPVSEMPDE